MLKKALIILASIVGIIVIVMIGMRQYTKSFSPQDISKYDDKQYHIEVAYSRPFKKGRTIFPDLLPYGEVWRTGANEATTITTNHDLIIMDQLLPKGTYSLWTIPGEEQWTVIFNKQTGQWGLDPFSGKANRDEDMDILTVTVPVYPTTHDIEQFTIQFETWENIVQMLLMWDRTIVVVPLEKS